LIGWQAETKFGDIIRLMIAAKKAELAGVGERGAA